MKHIKTEKGSAMLAVLLTLISAIAFFSCAMENYAPFSAWDKRFEHLGLSAEKLRRISHDFNTRLSESCNCPGCQALIMHYFGTYNGYVVMVHTDGRSIYPFSTVTVAGVEFYFSYVHFIFFAWSNNGRIYDIRDAFELGFFTSYDIETMHERRRRGETRGGIHD